MGITGKIHTVGDPIKVWKNFTLSINNTLQVHANDLLDVSQEVMKSWEIDLKRALGVQLSKKYWHRKRPNFRKKFPYRNTGKMQENITASAKMKVTGQGNFSITSWADIAVPYASYTNLGLRKRKNSKGTAGWTGWVDDVLYGDGRGGVSSVSDVFNILVSEREAIRGYKL
jgi:hypothetical protein